VERSGVWDRCDVLCFSATIAALERPRGPSKDPDAGARPGEAATAQYDSQVGDGFGSQGSVSDRVFWSFSLHSTMVVVVILLLYGCVGFCDRETMRSADFSPVSVRKRRILPLFQSENGGFCPCFLHFQHGNGR
jgi:hypothetical protein